MSTDPELLKDFITEVGTLEAELNGVVASLRGNPDQPPLYGKFAQLIDRIYGTAGTLGFKDLAAYCGMLKKTCYACEKPEAKRAQAKVLRLMEACMENLGALIKGINDPTIIDKMRHALHLEAQKANKLHDEIFQFVKKA